VLNLFYYMKDNWHVSLSTGKHLGLKVISTTRKPEKEEYLKANGADLVIIDNGSIKEKVKNLFPNGVDKVLELIGTRTLIRAVNNRTFEFIELGRCYYIF